MAATTKPTAAKPRSAGELKRITDLIKERGIKVIDVKFADLPGTWQHFSIPAETLDEDMVKEGLGFDGSSIRGFQAINESDML
ncbi:MAG TPA: glutamine synthetase, partial [Gemmatimonadales bacterium]|nr:glutamine synthetase [Gemmatimonadales bacterium]